MKKKKFWVCLLIIGMMMSTDTEAKAANINTEISETEIETPVPSETPEVSETPIPSEPSEMPESSEMPAPSETPIPSEMPVPSMEPEEPPVPIDVKILFVNKSFTLAQKQTRKLGYETDLEIEEDLLKWRSSDTDIATVNQNGVVKAKAVGEADIILETADGSGSAAVKVKVTKRVNGTQYSESGLDIVSTGTAKYTYDAMEKDISELKERYGDCLTIRELSDTYDGRQIYAIVLGNPEADKKLMVQSAIHAREYMASMLTMRQVELYCKNYYNGTYKGKYFSELFENVAVYIVPMVNPDGVTISQYGTEKINSKDLKQSLIKMRDRYGSGRNSYFTRWKANARGVDLNRNFDAHWSIVKNGKNYPNAELYKGTSPVSEKESKALVNLFEEIDPEAAISYHAMGSILYWDYGQTGKQRSESQLLRDTVNSLVSYSPVYGFSKSQAAGFSDWVSIKKKTPALTLEIGRVNCPLPLSQFSSIWSRNKLVMAAAAELYQ